MEFYTNGISFPWISVLLLLHSNSVYCHSNGNIGSACVSMTPGHDMGPQMSNPPYTLTITDTQGNTVTKYTPGQTLIGKSFELIR